MYNTNLQHNGFSSNEVSWLFGCYGITVAIASWFSGVLAEKNIVPIMYNTKPINIVRLPPNASAKTPLNQLAIATVIP
jgi:predicted MFS family arabinose efflux permease